MILLTTLIAVTTCFNLNAAENSETIKQQECEEIRKNFLAAIDAKFDKFGRGVADIERNAQENTKYFDKVIAQSYEQRSKEVKFLSPGWISVSPEWISVTKTVVLEQVLAHIEVCKQKQEALNAHKEQFEADLKIFLTNFKKDFRESNAPRLKSHGFQS